MKVVYVLEEEEGYLIFDRSRAGSPPAVKDGEALSIACALRGVFKTRQKAEAIAKRINMRHYRISTWNIIK
jgi:hypothetical protein